MRVEQEDFDKLSQLDRIEYRQVAKQIEENYTSHATLNFTLIIIFGFALWIGFVFIMKYLAPETLTFLLWKTKKLGFLAAMMFPIWVFVDLYIAHRKNKYMNELDSKYFKHEVNKRK